MSCGCAGSGQGDEPAAWTQVNGPPASLFLGGSSGPMRAPRSSGSFPWWLLVTVALVTWFWIRRRRGG